MRKIRSRKPAGVKSLFALTLCLLLSLPACGSTLEGGDTPAPEMPAAPSQPLGGDLEGELPYGVPVDFDPSGLPEAFAAAIGDYCRTGVFPDGGEPREIPGRFSYAVLDIDGDCGGYNLQWAWSSGYLAGRCAL